MPELAVIIPTRGRPDNVRKVIDAWTFTGAWDHADLILVVDADDPEIRGYHELAASSTRPSTGAPMLRLMHVDQWRPMVHKLDRAARELAEDGRYRALGFAGDDHLPRTIGWVAEYLTALADLGTGMVYGDDGYQGVNLSTEWAVTSDIVRALGRMIPAPVEHMYSDVSLLELCKRAGIVRHLPHVRIEHMHPIVRKAVNDEQYQRVNSREQFARDRLIYQTWQRGELGAQLHELQKLTGRTPSAQARPTRNPRRRVVTTVTETILPRHFKKVRGATPDAIGLALADMATQVPQDHAIVELGVFQGRTALLMAWGARQGLGAHVWGIDAWDLEANTYGPPFKDKGSRHWARYNVRALGYANQITLTQGFSLAEAERWQGPPIGLLFVDGDHSYEGARGDILAWSIHLADGAVIAVDDYGHPDWPGVAQAVDELVSEGVLEPIRIFHDRLAVTKLSGAGRPPVAITSEGVSPAPAVLDPAEEEQLAHDRVKDLSDPTHREVVWAEELDEPPGFLGIQGSLIEELNTAQLRALAKARGIRLGTRKDKRDQMLDALRAGE